LGVRPEHLSTSNDPRGAAIAIRIDQVEMLGHSMNIRGATVSGQPITARVKPGESLRAGQSATLCVEPDDIHLFEPGEFGRRLAIEPGQESRAT
jgi:ABC-type sugar transport system ATPase subunit